MKPIFITLFLIIPFLFIAQVNQIPHTIKENQPKWVQMMYAENPNLFELRDEYDAYYKTHPFIKNYDTQFFKRLLKENWIYVDNNGFIQRPPYDPFLEKKYLNQKEQNELSKSANSQWQELGPWQYDHEQAMDFQVQSPGSAHVYTCDQSLTNDQLVYAGTASAGLWKSTNKGLSWSLVTKNLLVNSVYSVAIDPIDNNIVYFGEENGTIWKTIDGGVNWSKTGSNSFQSTAKWIRDLKIIAPNTLLAATDAGLFRSTDAGANWTSVRLGDHMEIEINPADDQMIYTVKRTSNKTEFYKSTDAGLTWVLKPTGWPSPPANDEQLRTEIGVSAANPNIVYAWASGIEGVNEGFYGFYKSIDAGESFTFECCGGSPGGTATVDDPNMMGWSEDGTENGGQIYYDLAFGASPLDESRIYGAGINVWRSDNGGTDWELNAHWVTWVGEHTPYRYSHADVHDVKFFQHGSTTDMWVCSDGGIFYSSDQGDNIAPRMHGIHGTDFWGFQAGFKDGDVMVGGTYHNGTLIKYKDIYHGGLNTPNANGWLAELGGDNYRGFVNYGDSKIGYHDNGAFQFSPVRTTRISSKAFDDNNNANTSYSTGEYGNFGFSPNNYNTFYSPVGTKLMYTTNGGVSFEEIYDFGGSKIIQIKVSWSNPDYIYVTHKPSSGVTKIMKSIDKGTTWIDVTPSGTVTNNNQNRSKYIEVDEKDPNKLWCILIGGQTGNKVFKSIDGGINWTNITTPTLNNENVVSIFHHYGSDDGIYIGTTRAVYYKNNSMSDWALFNNELPASTYCSFLEPFYAGGKVRTATQRSVFECDLYENVPPVAMISANKNDLNIGSDCLADTIQFVDHSTVRTLTGTWLWTFEGGTPATSTLENPKVIYAVPGIYDVKLIVTDEFGSDSITLVDFVTVTNQLSNQTILETFDGDAFPPEGWKLYDNTGSSWEQDWPEGNDTNRCASFPNYWENATNEQHYLILPAMSFEYAVEPSISFDYSYSTNGGAYEDSLELIYRTGDNSNWQRIWVKGGDELDVAETAVWFWYDTDPVLAWERETVDLSFLNGTKCLELAFSNIGVNGNHIWIDSVNIQGDFTVPVTPEDPYSFTGISVFPNPSTGLYTVKTSKQDEEVTWHINNAWGELIAQDVSATIDISTVSAGIYFLTVTSSDTTKMVKLIKK